MKVTPDNRIISTPYPKYLNAVMDVDMSAAVIVTDAETARASGMAPDGIGYLRGWADANERLVSLGEAERLESPALVGCVDTAFGAAGLGPDDLSGFDLYACFPSSVEVARDSFGIAHDDERPSH